MFDDFGDHCAGHGFVVSKDPLCIIERWTIRWQTEVNVSNIFKNLLYFTRFVKPDIVHEHERLSIKAKNDPSLKELLRTCLYRT